MRRISLLICFPLALAAIGQHAEHGIAPEKALQMLQHGNNRFATGKPKHPNQSVARRQETAKGQHPFAVVLTCSDSRLSPELLFDQGVGDLFVLRVAGNTADPAMIGSVEYGVEHLGATVVVVLGHSKCGAVDAAIKGGDMPGSLPEVVAPILPAVEETFDKPGDRMVNTIKQNVRNTVRHIRKSSSALEELESQKKIRLVGGYYDLSTGKANFFRVD